MMEEHCECGGQFWSPGKSKGVSEGCPNCNRPYRDQPSPTISDMDMAMKEMPEAAGDGGLNSDMSGNPLKSGILADNGWQNRNKRDEFSGSVKRETFDMEPILPWWITSAEEHNIEGDAEIGSVMPPTSSDSPTIEAKLNQRFGWHNAMDLAAGYSLDSRKPPLVIDGEEWGLKETWQSIHEQYDRMFLKDNPVPSKIFMISHPDQEYLEAVKEVIEIGGVYGPLFEQIQKEEADKKFAEFAEKHGIYDSELQLPAREERSADFHTDHMSLSRALYGTQAMMANGHPYLSGSASRPHANTKGYDSVNQAYNAGESVLPISTSHPELGEVLQRVSDLDSMEPLHDWLSQHPEVSEDQRQALNWLHSNNIIDHHQAKIAAGETMAPRYSLLTNAYDDPFGLLPENKNKRFWNLNDAFKHNPSTDPLGKILKEGPATAEDLAKRPPVEIPKTAPQTPAPKPGVPTRAPKMLGPAGAGLAAAELLNSVFQDNQKGKPIPTGGFTTDINKPSVVPWALDNFGDLAAGAGSVVGDIADNLFGGPSEDIQEAQRQAEEEASPKPPEDLKPSPTSPTPEKPAPVPNKAPTPNPAPAPKPVETKPEQPNDKINPGDIAGALGAGAVGGAGLGAGKSPSPSPKPSPKLSPKPDPRPQKTKERNPKKRKFTLPNPKDINWEPNHLGPDYKYTNIDKSSVGIPDGTGSSEKLKVLHNIVMDNVESEAPMGPNHIGPDSKYTNIKRSDLDDAREHPSSHSEIPAEDITDPDKIDPHQKKEDDNSDWQKDYSVNDIGGAKQDPGAVVVTISHDSEPFSVDEISDMFGVDKDSEPVKLITDFWDHFMDHVDKPEHERDNDDPVLSLLKELLGNERDNGSK